MDESLVVYRLIQLVYALRTSGPLSYMRPRMSSSDARSAILLRAEEVLSKQGGDLPVLLKVEGDLGGGLSIQVHHSDGVVPPRQVAHHPRALCWRIRRLHRHVWRRARLRRRLHSPSPARLPVDQYPAIRQAGERAPIDRQGCLRKSRARRRACLMVPTLDGLSHGMRV